MGLEVRVTFLGADREGHEGRVVIDRFGRGTVTLGKGDRDDTDGGRDLGGFLGGADLDGLGFKSSGLEGGGFGFDGLDGFGEAGDGGVLDGGFDLQLLEFRGGADGEFLDSGTEVIAFGGEAREGSRGFEELFFDGHILGGFGIKQASQASQG